MEATSSKSSSVASSPFSSPNLGALLKIRVISWSQETGLPVTVRVRVRDKIFNLHKHQLFSKSGYFKRAFELEDSNDLELPESFPGGPDTFGTLALFLYGSSTMVDPFNVVALRCAAEFLEMTELSERFDLYLTKVALQSWEDTLIVLQNCRPLLPLAEELLIVGRCIESLAFMACMEILDPDRRQDRHVAALETQSETIHDCSSEATTMTTTRELWIKDLIALPFEFFKRVIRSLRRQGMKERYIAPIIVFYANKWVISKKTKQFWDDDNEEDAGRRVSSLLRGVLDLLRPSRHVLVGVYFVLLSRSHELDSKKDYGGIEAEIEERIVTSLHTARAEDLLLIPSLATMERIVSRYASSDPEKNSTVAELWDSYVSRIALDPKIRTERFVELIERVPISFRQSHDHLYTAMSAFLRAHPSITQEERSFACKSLICQRLSQEMCVQAVQNESMPLRLIVQALFAQQLNTHRAFKDCSDSFRRPKDNDDHFSKEYDSTSFRIQSLEQELESLKKSLQRREDSNGLKYNRSTSKKSKPKPKPKPFGQATTNCIGSVSFASRRRCGDRLLKIFRRIAFFGSEKPKQKQS